MVGLFERVIKFKQPQVKTAGLKRKSVKTRPSVSRVKYIVSSARRSGKGQMTQKKVF